MLSSINGRIIRSPILFIILVWIVLGLYGVQKRHLTRVRVMGEHKKFGLVWIHLSTLDIDEGINAPANGASLVHLEPFEDAGVVELMGALQFEVLLADLAVGEADGAVEQLLGLSGFHVAHLPGRVDDHLLVLDEDVAIDHHLNHPTDEPSSPAIRTHHLSCLPFLLDGPLDRRIPAPLFPLPVLQPLLKPLAALHHPRLHHLHERPFPSARVTHQSIHTLQLQRVRVHLGTQPALHLLFLVEHVAVGADNLVLDPVKRILFHYYLLSSPQ